MTLACVKLRGGLGVTGPDPNPTEDIGKVEDNTSIRMVPQKDKSFRQRRITEEDKSYRDLQCHQPQ